MVGMTTPMHSLLIDRNVHQVIIELHHHYFIVLEVGIKEQGQLTSPIAPSRYPLVEIILKVVRFQCLQQFPGIRRDVPVLHLVAFVTLGDLLPQLVESQLHQACLLYTSPSPRDATLSRMPSSA